jgi:copper chaperone
MTVITVNGMKCQHCAGSTKKALEGIDGITNAVVDLEKNQVSFEGNADMETIKAAVAGAGFEVVEQAE